MRRIPTRFPTDLNLVIRAALAGPFQLEPAIPWIELAWRAGDDSVVAVRIDGNRDAWQPCPRLSSRRSGTADNRIPFAYNGINGNLGHSDLANERFGQCGARTDGSAQPKGHIRS